MLAARLRRLCGTLLILLAFHAAAGEAPVFAVAVVPQFTPLQVHKNWGPFLERVAQLSGVSLKLKVYERIPDFEADILAGVPDFAFMNPYHVVMVRRAAAAYRPLVHDSRPLTGILLVRRDNAARSLRDLDGARIAFPAPNALGASLYMRALLAEAGIVGLKPDYVKTHSNVFRQVIVGAAAAGGAVNNTFDREPEAVRTQLRVLFETPPMVPHPLAVHPRVPSALGDAVAAAVIALRKNPADMALLRAVQMPDPMVADYERDYRPLERLKLDKYVVAEEEEEER